MKNINIIEKIGSGMLGDVFKCSIKDDENNYALKIEKIEDNNLKYNLSTQEWREIEFSQAFANNYPDYFITLCCYDIIKHETNREYNYNQHNISEKTIKRLQSKSQSKYAIRRLYTLVDNNLKNVIDTFTKKQLYSTIVQVLYICYLMHSNGYSHNDLHTKYIGVTFVDPQQYIKISNKKVLSHGIQIRALDFGIVKHKKYELSESELHFHNYGLINDINRFLIRLVTYESSSDIKKIYNWNDCPEIFKQFLELDDYSMLEKFATNKYDKFYLFQLICPEKFQKMLLGKKYKQLSKPMPRIDLVDLLFIFKNKTNPRATIKYFIKLTNSKNN